MLSPIVAAYIILGLFTKTVVLLFIKDNDFELNQFIHYVTIRDQTLRTILFRYFNSVNQYFGNNFVIKIHCVIGGPLTLKCLFISEFAGVRPWVEFIPEMPGLVHIIFTIWIFKCDLGIQLPSSN